MRRRWRSSNRDGSTNKEERREEEKIGEESHARVRHSIGGRIDGARGRACLRWVRSDCTNEPGCTAAGSCGQSGRSVGTVTGTTVQARTVIDWPARVLACTIVPEEGAAPHCAPAPVHTPDSCRWAESVRRCGLQPPPLVSNLTGSMTRNLRVLLFSLLCRKRRWFVLKEDCLYYKESPEVGAPALSLHVASGAAIGSPDSDDASPSPLSSALRTHCHRRWPER